MLRSTSLVAGLLLLATCGCRATDCVRPPAPSEPIVVLDPSPEDLDLPSLVGLSDAGLLSLKVLAEATHFTGDRVGEGGSAPVQVEAWRILAREPDAAHAFRYLARGCGGSSPGKLFGLCGLWLKDRVAFLDEFAALKEDCGDATVPTFFGCLLGETPVADLLPAIEDGTFPRMFLGAR